MLDGDLRQARHVGDPPRLGAVGHVAVAQHDHRGHVADRDPPCLAGHVEAVGRAARGQHRQRALAVAAEEGLEQVGLLGLGGHAGARAGPLHVDDQQRQLGHHGQADALRLSAAMPGPLVPVTAMAPPKAAPMAEVTAAISSSAWKVRTPKFLRLDSSCRMSLAGVIG